MGRFLRFFLVLNMWLGFNYGIIVNLYRALPTFDRPLFIFIYVMLVVIPPCLFYTYLTFIFDKNYVHSYELKKFIKKKLHLNHNLLETLMISAGLVFRDGGYLSQEFTLRLNLLKKQINLSSEQEIIFNKAFQEGQNVNFPIKAFIRYLSVIRKIYGPHLCSWLFIALLKLLEDTNNRHIYPQNLLKTLERLRSGLKLKQDVYYRLENNFLLFDSEQKSNFTNNSKYTYFYSFSEPDEVEQKLKNAYQTLELPINSSAEDVHRQYRKLIFKYHPDRLSEHQRQNPAMIKEAKEKIEAIYSAYHLICEHQNKKIG